MGSTFLPKRQQLSRVSVKSTLKPSTLLSKPRRLTTITRKHSGKLTKHSGNLTKKHSTNYRGGPASKPITGEKIPQSLSDPNGYLVTISASSDSKSVKSGKPTSLSLTNTSPSTEQTKLQPQKARLIPKPPPLTTTTSTQRTKPMLRPRTRRIRKHTCLLLLG